MACYAVGDIHGHRVELEMLLARIGFAQGADQLWCVGDLVNRGPDSVGVLRLLRSLGESAVCTAGNHDLYLLAGVQGLVPRLNAAGEIQRQPDGEQLLRWLAELPLMVAGTVEGSGTQWLMSHAGFHPQWSRRQAEQLAASAQRVLRRNPAAAFPQQAVAMPDWSLELHAEQTAAAVLFCLTQMRRLSVAEAAMPAPASASAADVPASASGANVPASASAANVQMPWYEYPLKVLEDSGTELLFGHWASLGGRTGHSRVHALDTGCCWGRQLTAMRLQDKRRFSVDCISPPARQVG